MAVGALLLVTWLGGQQIRAQEMVLAVLVFSLTYPGSVPFRDLPAGVHPPAARQLGAGHGPAAAVRPDDRAAAPVRPEHARRPGSSPRRWSRRAPTGCRRSSLRKLVALRPEQTAIVVAANSLGRALARSIQNDPLSQTRIMAFFDDRTPERLGEVLEAPVAGGFDSWRSSCAPTASTRSSSPCRWLRSRGSCGCWKNCATPRPRSTSCRTSSCSTSSRHGSIRSAGCRSWPSASRRSIGTTGVLKRLSDLVIATLALVFTAPLMVIIALAIKLTSRGPVIFKQRRYGLDGSEINVYKFRSMTGPGERQTRSSRQPETMPGSRRVGAFLRRTSLDELPQFFNVVQGRMSVVGPRPHAVAHNEMYRKLIKGYMIRHKVKPGHHRPRPGQRRPRRNRHGREDGSADPLRPRVPAPLVAAAGPADHRQDAARRISRSKRVLTCGAPCPARLLPRSLSSPGALSSFRLCVARPGSSPARRRRSADIPPSELHPSNWTSDRIAHSVAISFIWRNGNGPCPGKGGGSALASDR